MPETLLGLLVLVAIAGVVLWVVTQFPALDKTMANIIRVIVIAVVAIACIYFLAAWVQSGNLRLR